MLGFPVFFYRGGGYVDSDIPTVEDDREWLRLGCVVIDMLQAVAMKKHVFSDGVYSGGYGYLFQISAFPKCTSFDNFYCGWQFDAFQVFASGKAVEVNFFDALWDDDTFQVTSVS